DLPPTLVNHPVMAVTEQGEIRQIAATAMDPMHHVMRRGPARRSLTIPPDAAVVAGIQRLALRPRDNPPGPPDIDDHGVGVEQDAGDRAVTGQSLDRLGRDGKRELELCRRSTLEAEQRLQRGGHLQMGALAGALRYQAIVEV